MSRRWNVKAFFATDGTASTGTIMTAKRRKATCAPGISADASFAAKAMTAKQTAERAIRKRGRRDGTGGS